MTLLCLCICCSSSGQTNARKNISVYTDILSFFKRGTASIGFDYSFNERWSAGGCISYPIGPDRIRESEEMVHDMSLSGHKYAITETSASLSPEYGISICHWPVKYHEGAYLRLICLCPSGYGTELTLGVGYAINICRHCGVTIGYEFNLLSIDGTDSNRYKRINVSLSYRF